MNDDEWSISFTSIQLMNHLNDNEFRFFKVHLAISQHLTQVCSIIDHDQCLCSPLEIRNMLHFMIPMILTKTRRKLGRKWQEIRTNGKIWNNDDDDDDASDRAQKHFEYTTQYTQCTHSRQMKFIAKWIVPCSMWLLLVWQFHLEHALDKIDC